MTCLEFLSRGVGERKSGTTAPSEAATFCLFPYDDSTWEEFPCFFTPEDILRCDENEKWVGGGCVCE